MSDKLLPCPWCGQRPRAKNGYNARGEKFFLVSHDCQNILSEIKTFCRDTEEEAASDWNCRVDHSGEANGMISGKDINVATNADRIRSMSDEELAKFLLSWVDCDKEEYMCTPIGRNHFGACDGRCVNGRINWLRQPSKEGRE